MIYKGRSHARSARALNFIFHFVLRGKSSSRAARLSYEVLGSVQPGYNSLPILFDSFLSFFFFQKYCTNVSLELHPPILKRLLSVCTETC